MKQEKKLVFGDDGEDASENSESIHGKIAIDKEGQEQITKSNRIVFNGLMFSDNEDDEE